MKYDHIEKGTFLSRPNRFIARVEIGGREETVHVKNTGRCKELLLPGAEVYLEHSQKPGRKTAYDLVAVEKRGLGIVNMDSQAPNVVVREWLLQQQAFKEELRHTASESDRENCFFTGLKNIRPEYTFGQSRIDFYFEREEKTCLMEVKGVTLEREGIAYFPDAPTARGVKHIRELEAALEKGYECYLAFVLQLPGVRMVYPNDETHPEFGEALRQAQARGLQVLALECLVESDRLEVSRAREICASIQAEACRN